MKLYWKLFLALFAAVLVGAGALALLSQWRLDRGFVEYVNAADAELLPGLAQLAGRLYQRQGSWEALREEPQLWFRQARMAIQLERQGDVGSRSNDGPTHGRPRGERRRDRPPPRRDSDRRPPPRNDSGREEGSAEGEYRRPPGPPPRRRPPPPAQRFDSSPPETGDGHGDGSRPERRSGNQNAPPHRQRPPPRGDRTSQRNGRPPPPRRRQGLHERIAIVDTERNEVAARFSPLASMPSAPVLVNGVEVGQVILQTVDRPNSAQDDAFLLAQRDWLLQVVLIMLPIAALIAYLLARHLLAPVRAISASARRLAGGDFQARVSQSGGDELGRLGEDFNVLGRALAEHDGARRRWMADAAHELRTPLAVLQGEIEALQDGIRPTNEQALHALHAQTLQLSTLVNDLQQLAMADAGALDYRMDYLSIDEHIIEAADAHLPRLNQAGIELIMVPELALKARVLGDSRRLRQLFDNLIENSLRYTRGPGQLQLTREIDGLHWVAHFDDSEPGVDEALCERLFEPFVRDPERLRDVPTEASGGGLGLAICRRIAQAHGAELSASPSTQGGLRISLKLPLARQ